MRHTLRLPAHFAGGFLTLTLLAGSTHADVLVVHATDGPFTTIQGAVDAALSGDTILVKPGSYGAFIVDAKGLTLAGDSGGPVLVSGACAVRNLPAGTRATVSGLTIAVPDSWWQEPDHYLAALTLEDNIGEVRVDACSLTGKSNSSWGGTGGAGAWVHGNVGSVALVGCTVIGGRGEGSSDWATSSYLGGAGLDLQNTRVAVYDCALTGGRGGDGFSGSTADGAPGAQVRTSTTTSGMFASGTLFQGGRGGDDWEDVFAEFTHPGDGGNGLQLDTGTSVQLLDNTYFGGAPGIGVNCIPTDPPSPGVGIAGPGHAFLFNVTRVKLAAPVVARESTNVALAVHGQPGEDVFLFSSLATGFAIMPSWRGALIPTLRSPALAMILGTIPASGVLDVSFDLPALPAGVAARDLYLQTWRRDANGSVTLGSFAVVTVLDAIY